MALPLRASVSVSVRWEKENNGYCESKELNYKVPRRTMPEYMESLSERELC